MSTDTEQLIVMLQKQLARNDELVDRHESHYQDMRTLAISYAELTREIMGTNISHPQIEIPQSEPDPAIGGGELS